MTSAVVAPLPLAKVGTDQVAYSLSFVVAGHPASVSIVMVRKGDDEFEMVLDEVATQPEDVVVRNPGNGSTACLRAAELVLIGFRSRTRQ